MTKPKRKHVRTRPLPNEQRADDLAGPLEAQSEMLPPVSAADPLSELAPVVPVDAGPAPDAQAAFASLEPQPEVPNVDAKGDALPEPASAGPESTLGQPAPLPADYERWSKRAVRAKSKSALGERVLELQKLLESRPVAAPAPLSGPVTTPATLDECRELLERVIPAVDALIVYAGGDVFKTTAKDQELLVSTTAPVALPHYDALKSKLPWIPAGVAALAVYLPKALEKVKEQRAKAKAKHKGPGATDPYVDSDGTPAAVVYDFPARARQYGGPNE